MSSEKSFNPALLSSLHSVVIPGDPNYLRAGNEKSYDSAYQLWRSVMNKTVSDEFVMQHEIQLLCYEDMPIGLLAFNWMDLQQEAVCHHSACQGRYPERIIHQLRQNELNSVMTMSQLTVHPYWRKSRVGPCVSDILLGFAVKRLLDSPADLLLSFSLGESTLSSLALRYGGQALESAEQTSEILAFYPDAVRVSPVAGIQNAVDVLSKKQLNLRIDQSVGEPHSVLDHLANCIKES